MNIFTIQNEVLVFSLTRWWITFSVHFSRSLFLVPAAIFCLFVSKLIFFHFLLNWLFVCCIWLGGFKSNVVKIFKKHIFGTIRHHNIVILLKVWNFIYMTKYFERIVCVCGCIYKGNANLVIFINCGIFAVIFFANVEGILFLCISMIDI